MPGIRNLQKIQFGRESTPGTAVAATKLWRGLGAIEDRREVVFPDETVGYLSGLDRAYVPAVFAGVSFDDTPATFEQLPYIFDAGIKTVNATNDGTGSGKIYTYPLPTTTAPTIKTYTIEAGDNEYVEEVEYAFVESFRLAGKAREAVMLSAEWAGRRVTASSFTSGITPGAVEEILFQRGKLFIDAISGNYGTTQASSTLLGMTLDMKTGWTPVFTADGNLYFSYHALTQPELTLQLTMLYNTTTTAEKVNWRDNVSRRIQLKFEGSALTTPGTSYQYKTFIINLCGRWEKFDKLGEEDGNDIITATFRARYNLTASDFGTLIVVNEVASL